MQPGMVNADRLQRMKCPVCGSKEKNVCDCINERGEKVLKVMACNQCGYLTMFGLAATVVPDLIMRTLKGADTYEAIVRGQHEGNHPE